MKLILIVVIVMLASSCAVVPVDGSGKSTLVCHKGNKTLELPKEAVRAHLNHGDRLGGC